MPPRFKQWKALGLSPSPLCGDDEFIRRASLDITGTLPTAEEVKTFIALSDPGKRARLVDRLLDRPEYASFFAIKWADILRNKREGRAEVQSSTYNFHDWIRESLARNVPYDQFVRGILAASGSSETAPAVQWYRKLRETSAFVDDSRRCFWGCGCSVPSATTIPSRNGASTITTASRRSLRVWDARRT